MTRHLADDEQRKMRQVLFYSFMTLFVALTILTILSLFFGLTSLKEKYESTFVTAFILEVGAAIAALFYLLFGIKKAAAVSEPSHTRLRIYISATDNGLRRGGNYSVYYEILDEDTGQKNKIDNVHTQWEVDGSLGFSVKEVQGNIYIMFGIKDQNGQEWISDHFKPGSMRFQKLNQLN